MKKTKMAFVALGGLFITGLVLLATLLMGNVLLDWLAPPTQPRKSFAHPQLDTIGSLITMLTFAFVGFGMLFLVSQIKKNNLENKPQGNP